MLNTVIKVTAVNIARIKTKASILPIIPYAGINTMKRMMIIAGLIVCKMYWAFMFLCASNRLDKSGWMTVNNDREII